MILMRVKSLLEIHRLNLIITYRILLAYFDSFAILPWVSGKNISNEKKKNIIAEKGNKISLSPVLKFEYPNRVANIPPILSVEKATNYPRNLRNIKIS